MKNHFGGAIENQMGSCLVETSPQGAVVYSTNLYICM